MKKKLIALLLVGLGAACNANAATWYAFTENGSDTASYFFDWDTVSKRSGVITLWTKTVHRSSVSRENGIQSFANKRAFDCKKRTVQSLTEVQFDKSGEHIKTVSKPMAAQEAVPGSIGEGLWQVICARDFPNRKSSSYVRVDDNDVFAATERMFDSYDAAAASK